MNPAPLAALSYEEDGAELFPRAAAECLGPLLAAVEGLPKDRAGIRIAHNAALRPLLFPADSIARDILGPDSRAVRAILFDKTTTTNWSLGWHQDRTVCVRDRIAVDGFGPWTVKSGMHHVEPPFGLLARMITLRIHLDDVPVTNAPLMIAPGSHRAGRIAESAVTGAVRRYGIATCLAAAGDVWLYSTPILHASQTASVPSHRRVLQIDYAAEDLPERLEWLGV